MKNMLADEQYAYMRGLNDFRNYLVATHYDPSRRNWIGRTCNDDKTITISPVAYSPAHCIDLIRFALALDAEERDSAASLGIAPRFQLLSEADVLAVDFLLNRYGYTTGLVACGLYRDIAIRGQRFPVPTDVPTYPNRGFPEPVRVPFADDHYDDLHAGLRDLEAGVAGCESLILKNGEYFSGGVGGDEFRVDEEGAEFLGFELDYALDKYQHDIVAPAAVVHYMLRMGMVELYRGQHREVDRMLRVANQIHRKNLRPILHDREALVRALAGGDAAGQGSLFEAA